MRPSVAWSTPISAAASSSSASPARAAASRGGFRTIVLFRDGERAFFVHGFAKSDLGNIRADELAAFRMLASHLLAYDDPALAAAVGAGALMEIMSDG